MGQHDSVFFSAATDQAIASSMSLRADPDPAVSGVVNLPPEPYFYRREFVARIAHRDSLISELNMVSSISRDRIFSSISPNSFLSDSQRGNALSVSSTKSV